MWDVNVYKCAFFENKYISYILTMWDVNSNKLITVCRYVSLYINYVGCKYLEDVRGNIDMLDVIY